MTTVSGGAVSGFNPADTSLIDQTLTSPLSDVTITGATLQANTDSTATPAVTGLSPSFASAGGPGFILNVIGTGFVSGAAVLWNGGPLMTSFVNSTQLDAPVPAALLASAASAANIIVLNPEGGGSDAAAFNVSFGPGSELILTFTAAPNHSDLLLLSSGALTYSGAPVLTTALYDGQTLLGTYTSALVAGKNYFSADFAPAGGGLGDASSNPTTVPYDSVTSGQIGGRLVVSVTGGSVLGLSAASLFLFDYSSAGANASAKTLTDITVTSLTIRNTPAPPSVAKIDPSAIAAGGPGFTLAVTGSGFVSGDTVQWNGVPLSTSLVGAAQLIAQVPANMIGLPVGATITVLNADGASSNPASLDVVLTPGAQLVVTFTAALLAGDELYFVDNSPLTITGSPVFTTSLYNGERLLGTCTSQPYPLKGAMTFVALFSSPLDDVCAPGRSTPVAFDGSTINGSLVTTVAGGAISGFYLAKSWPQPGFAPVATGLFLSDLIPQPNGSILSRTLIYLGYAWQPGSVTSVTVRGKPEPVPIISGLSPLVAAAGVSSFTLTVTGSNFVTGSAVQWNGSPLATTFVNSAQLNATVPSSITASAGMAAVSVINPDGVGSNALSFTVYQPAPPLPSIAAVVNAASFQPEPLSPGAWMSILDRISANPEPLPTTHR